MVKKGGWVGGEEKGGRREGDEGEEGRRREGGDGGEKGRKEGDRERRETK